jgi:hypothetical protein
MVPCRVRGGAAEFGCGTGCRGRVRRAGRWPRREGGGGLEGDWWALEVGAGGAEGFADDFEELFGAAVGFDEALVGAGLPGILDEVFR